MNYSKDAALALLVGGIPFAFAVWCWHGRSKAARWWVGNPMNERMVLTIFPGWGLLFAPLGFMWLFKGTSIEFAVDNVFLVLVLLGALIGFWGFCFLPIPRWWGPGWFRRLTAKERTAKKKRAFDALTFVATQKPRVVSAAIGAKPYDLSTQVAVWRAIYVYDPDTTERAHGLAGRGSVTGRLTAYEGGLVFVATETE